MKKKLIIVILILVLLIFSVLGYFIYNYLRIKYAKKEVTLIDDLTLEFNEKKKVSDYILSINGKIIDDYVIDSTVLGNKEVSFSFINDDNIKVEYSFNVDIIDTVEPLIWLSGSYSVPVNSDIDLTNKIMCGDNYDSKPNCFIEGAYDLNVVGNYPLIFKAIDNSGNEESVDFVLNVYEPVIDNSTSDNKEVIYTDYNEVKQNYKANDVKIGIDISSWQGEVDFEKLKNAGVEFVIIRVGGTRGTDGEYFLDKNFEYNIKEANKYGIDAGVYFYSYSNTSESAIKDAKWVLKQIKRYDVKQVVFDWEEWSSFNEYNLSFFGLTNMAESFLSVVEKKGYEGVLYSSKSYLENVWLDTDYDVWLAHYTSETNYQGKYKFWQICDNGKIDGIDGFVDIDIMYNK